MISTNLIPGTVKVFRDRFYHLISIEPYIRKTDSQASQLLTWNAWCQKCGTIFPVRTGRTWPAKVNRHCQKHRRR